MHANSKLGFQSNNETDPARFMMMQLNPQTYDLEEKVNVEGSRSQQLFMMYSTENGDGSTTTSVAFAGVANTNIPPQFRPKQPRNIVTNSTQSMFAGTQRY